MNAKKHSSPPGICRPFKDLQTLIEKKKIKLAPSFAGKHLSVCRKAAFRSSRHSRTVDQKTRSNTDADLFMEAMADVSPLAQDDRIVNDSTPHHPKRPIDNCEDETMQQLNNLIRSGQGFVVADTSEYIEGTGYNVHPKIAKRLHRGEFSIQAHLDLHGLGVDDAKTAFDLFFKDAITTGKRAVLIVHGRGLSSPNKPVLKSKVVEWLTCGPWRKWLLAFSSARLFDGGAGATYVLLRRRPVTRSIRKRKEPL